jgi:hypothetical protein
MGIVVSSASENKRLVEVTTLRTRIGASSSADVILGEIVDEASQLIFDYLRRDLRQQTYVETRAGTNRREMVLRQAPVISVTHVKYQDGDAIDDTTYKVINQNSGILYRKDDVWTRTGLALTNLNPNDPVAGTESPDWEIQYVAGYKLPGETVSAGEFSLPSSIVSQAIVQCQFAFASTNRDPSVVLRKAEEIQEEYAATRLLVGHSGLLVSVERALNPYRFID